ncbi:MAG: OmpA family protein [Crocinitomicaceae bacterium]
MFTDKNTKETQRGVTNQNGVLLLNYPEQRLSLGTHIQVELKKDGYINHNFELDTIFTVGGKHDLNLTITKIEVGIDIAEAANLSKVESIFFDYNEAEILPTAEIELDKIVKLMNDNPEISIEIGSHTDARGSDSFNMALSKRRAKATAEYIKQRVETDANNRIKYKGYGESKLKNDCGNNVDCSEEEHRENRRSEFIIIKI